MTTFQRLLRVFKEDEVLDEVRYVVPRPVTDLVKRGLDYINFRTKYKF